MQACITIRHCANGLVILNKVVFRIVCETVKTVCKKFVFYNLRGCIYSIGQIMFKTLLR